MGLFTDLYQTVYKFFRPQEDTEGDASKSVATNRLKLVLMQDRTNLTPKILEQMRGELVDLLSKYLEMDKDLLELNFEQEGDQVALMLSIPVIRAKDEEEIERAIKASVSKDAEEVDEEETEEETDKDADEETSEEVPEISENSDDEVEENLSEDTKNFSDNDDDIIPKRTRTKKVSVPESMKNEESIKETETEIVTEE